MSDDNQDYEIKFWHPKGNIKDLTITMLATTEDIPDYHFKEISDKMVVQLNEKLQQQLFPSFYTVNKPRWILWAVAITTMAQIEEPWADPTCDHCRANLRETYASFRKYYYRNGTIHCVKCYLDHYPMERDTP